MFELSRLNITGKLSADTPLCVVLEVCESHGISVRSCKDINASTTNCVKEPYTKMDLQMICRYINPRCIWKRRSLMKAFAFLKECIGQEKIDLMGIEFYGQQRPRKESSINCCVLYSQCKLRGIHTRYETTISDMITMIRLHDSGDVGLVQAMLMSKMSDIPSMLSCLSILDMHFDNVIDECDSIKMVASKHNMYRPLEFKCTKPSFTDLRNEIKRQIQLIPNTINNPQSNKEAICAAAIRFGIDISDCSNAIDEFRVLCIEPYKPADGLIKRRTDSKTPHVDSPYLSVCFNPLLPIEFYTRKHINSLIELEGMAMSDFQSSYTILQSIYLMDTFFEGKVPFASKATCITGESLDDLDDTEVICYGTKLNNESKSFELTSIMDCFRVYKNFRDPSAKGYSYFSDQSILKLRRICAESCFKLDAVARTRRRELLQLIDEIKRDVGSLTQEEIYIKDLYNASDRFIRTEIIAMVQSLLELSMYMRGWDGLTPYPIKSAPVNNQHKVDVKVTEAIANFESRCISDNGRIFMRLRLYRWRSGEYYKCVDEEMGIRILDRLRLVKTGKSVYSCIRLTSNWFASSACKYFELLGLPTPFNIADLRDIA